MDFIRVVFFAYNHKLSGSEGSGEVNSKSEKIPDQNPERRAVIVAEYARFDTVEKTDIWPRIVLFNVDVDTENETTIVCLDNRDMTDRGKNFGLLAGREPGDEMTEIEEQKAEMGGVVWPERYSQDVRDYEKSRK